jgi:hypothetical protein
MGDETELRAELDETKIADCDAAEASRDALPVRYLHPGRVGIHLLDKPISFDDAQQSVHRQPPPLIVVGSADSGKTSPTLEEPVLARPGVGRPAGTAGAERELPNSEKNGSGPRFSSTNGCSRPNCSGS